MDKIGRFEILEELGRGSMGAVYKARDPQIGRVVAIKIILSAHLASDDLDQYRQRFQREAQAAGRMSHPGIVTIHDIAQDESGQPYLVMEFVEGRPLDKLLAAGSERLPLEKSFDIGIQVARALDYAHRRGVIHRDIKPANILLTHEGGVKIADFGIAKLAGTQMTQAGQVMGTPAFMSPEQFSGAAVDARSDLFSLGAVLYWMFTGERPFAGDTFTSMSFKIVYAPHIPPRQLQPALPESVDIVLGRALAKNPADRYQSCAELAADLEALRDGRPVAAKPLPAVELEKTVMSPPTPSAPVERTMPLPAAASQPGIKPSLKIAAAGVLILIIAFAGYWLWPGNKDASGTAPAQQATRSAPKPPPVPMSTLRVICLHNFSSAKLTISSDDTIVLQTTMRGQEGMGVAKLYRGRVSLSRPIPAGRRTLRVAVSAPDHDYQEDGEISGSFTEGGARTLHIEFGRGSALGVVPRKLTLSWQ